MTMYTKIQVVFDAEVQAGASIAWTNDTVRGNSIAMRDPEGNEFCVS
jgi:Glyoxalase-like domain